MGVVSRSSTSNSSSSSPASRSRSGNSVTKWPSPESRRSAQKRSVFSKSYFWPKNPKNTVGYIRHLLSEGAESVRHSTPLLGVWPGPCRHTKNRHLYIYVWGYRRQRSVSTPLCQSNPFFFFPSLFDVAQSGVMVFDLHLIYRNICLEGNIYIKIHIKGQSDFLLVSMFLESFLWAKK